jgi:hypothetical protein
MLTAVAAVAVAFAALLLSVYQARLLKRHYRLSVMPSLGVDVLLPPSDRYHGCALRNDGLGPALIRSVAVDVDGRFICRLAPTSAAQSWRVVLDAARLPDHIEYVARIPFPGEALSPRERLVLLECFGEDGEPLDDGDIMPVLRRVTLHIEYVSLYGDGNRLDVALAFEGE